MQPLTDTDGNLLSLTDEILEGFRKQNLLTNETPRPCHQSRRQPYKLGPSNIIRDLSQNLRQTSNNSALGPDGISYRLLKIIQDSDLGKAIINDIAFNIAHPLPHPPPWEGPKMAMIPKPNKDHTTVQGMCPIVLSNAASKLGEKYIANRLQRVHSGFHHLQYDSRKNRSVTDAMAQTVSLITQHLRGGARVSLLGKDIISAFNHLRYKETLQGDNSSHTTTSK